MKVLNVRIKNLFGLKEFDYDGKNIEITGKKGVGKTAFLDSVKYVLKNCSEREYILLNGAKEGEGSLETDTGLLIHRKKRSDKVDYKSIKQAGEKGQKTEGIIRDIFTELQLNPIEFTLMTKEQQNRIVLDLIDFKWDLKWIKEQFGELVPDVDYERNILDVLYQIQAEDGYYYQVRHDLNRLARDKAANVEEIGGDLPGDYNAKTWEKAELGPLYRQIEKISRDNRDIEKAKDIIENRDNKVRALEADYEIEISSIRQNADFTERSLKKSIEELKQEIKYHERSLSEVKEKTDSKITIAVKTHEAKVAKFEGEVKQHKEIAKKKIAPIDDLQEETKHIEKMKLHISEYNRMVKLQREIVEHTEKSEALTVKIDHARALPGHILETSNIPVPGLSVVDGLPLINGLPISNLSSGEQLELCIAIATQNKGKLDLLLLDGMEKLPSKDRAIMYKKLKKAGAQFIATRTDDTEVLTVREL